MIVRKNIRYCAFILFFILPAVLAGEEIKLTIEQAYDMCTNNSLSLKASRFELLAERRKQKLSVWESLPSLNFSLTDSRLTRYNAQDTNTINFSSSLTVPVFNGGRIKMQHTLKRLSLDIQTTLLSASEEELRNTCFSLFHQVQVLYLKKEAVLEMESLAEQQYKITEKEYELGKAREIDVIDTRLSLEEISHNLFTLESEILSNEYSFRKLLGLEESVEFSLVTKIDESYIGVETQNLAKSLYSIAEQKNVSLLQGRFSIEEARINNQIAMSKWIPNVKLQATVQASGDNYPLQNPDYGLRAIMEFPNELLPVNFSFGISTIPDNEYGRSVTGSATSPTTLAPIIDKQLTKVRLSQAVENYIDLQQDVRFSIEQSLLAYERQQRSQELLKKKIQTQEKKASILMTQAELGQITRLDYLEGANELLASRLQYLSGILTLIQLERQIESLAGLNAGDLQSIRESE